VVALVMVIGVHARVLPELVVLPVPPVLVAVVLLTLLVVVAVVRVEVMLRLMEVMGSG